MMNKKVSIIVPVYNSSKYLHQMIKSLLNQTLKDMEFIFIDDCSTDNSVEILLEFENKDPDRILIIRSEVNQGPGAARNIGLKYASGEYIGFVDSDDYIQNDMYETMYNKAKSNDYDIVECGYYNERKKKEMMIWDQNFEGQIDFDKRVKIIMSCGFICTKLFKRNIILENNIEFIPDIPLEDVFFLSRIYCKINSIGIVNKPFYYYRNNNNSFSYKKNGKTAFQVNNIFSKIYLESMKKEQIYNILQPVFEYVVMDIWYDTFRSYVTNNKNIKIVDLEVINNQIKQYIDNYDKNIFFIEQARVDNCKRAFLLNCSNSKKALEILKSDK